MNITSFEFALFFAVILPLNWLLRSRAGAYRLFLLLASYIFYASFNAKFLLILLVFSFLTWFFAVVFAETSDARFRRFCLVLYVAFSLGMLIFFKYYEMLYISADWLFRVLSVKSPVPLLDVIMPIGISFFTFQGMSYAIDVYRDPAKVERSLVEVFCFISFFPTILSGPILRAGSFLPQLKKERVSQVDFTRAFYLLTRGLIKKIIISSYLSEHIVRVTFGAPEGYSSAAVLVGILSYATQIYCDFSGYSDLAQGVGLLMGFDIPDNFNAPYTSLSLRDFWRRWHITFSTWLRDYLYISLGGNRKGTVRKYLNLVATMALGGLWHGAAYNFLVWGFIHGFGLVGAHMVGEFRSARLAAREAGRREALEAAGGLPEPASGPGVGSALWNAACWAVTFAYVNVAWVFFGAEDAGKAVDILRRVAAFDPDGATFRPTCLILVAVVLVVQLLHLTGRDFFRKSFEWLPFPAQGLALGVAAACILKLGPDGVLPFIYFQF
ncbi:putative poly(beta-D-mannuronate) O-acetylase [Desulfovibrio sp. DV]|uniref:MBOAT family O-acyltransferase n=1 Tax=Desulfovibrio sp. DV TaxID=1844708 RepID=UPI00094BAD32|nr:MBOAT family O-acyltransferase [Desulfovibrio sp. DV]OLN26162.1 putative poly(beta-D-mannuronate) O-acetylase [Desulfovibrio sp. DV]